MLSTAILAVTCFILVIIQISTVILVIWRLKQPQINSENTLPFISLVRPLCGLNAYEEETLRSGFAQNYPHYELLFCVASPEDPVISLVKKLIDDYPERSVKLLTGNDVITSNPKVNNLVKGWKEAQADWIVMTDSNLLLPPDYLHILISTFDQNTGLVSAPAVGCNPLNLWGAVEAAMLNTHQARWQYLVDIAGVGFAQGKTLCWRRDVLEAGGGLSVLGKELAEDVASTKLVRRAGLNVRLPAKPFFQPIGYRSFKQVWERQLRWSRIRRSGFFRLFLLEILTGSLPATAIAVYLSATGAVSWILPPALLMVWYGIEWVMAKMLKWPHSLRDVLAMMLRDGLLPLLWLWCWTGKGVIWRGSEINTKQKSSQPKQQKAH